MKPRKLSTKDRERFGGTSRGASRSSVLLPKDFGSEGDGEHVSGSEDGSSSASASGLAALDPPREPVPDEHWEMTVVGESNNPSGLGTGGTIAICSALITQSNPSTGTLTGRALRVALTDWVRSASST